MLSRSFCVDRRLSDRFSNGRSRPWMGTREPQPRAAAGYALPPQLIPFFRNPP